MATELAVGYVRIEPEAHNFQRNLEQAINPAATRAGDQAGQRIGQGINDRLGRLNGQLTPTLQRAGQAAGEAGGRAAGEGMARGIDGRLRDSRGRFAASLTEAGRGAGQTGGEAAGGGMASGLMDKLKGLGGKAGPMAAALGAAASLAGLSAAGLFAKALGDGMRQQQQLDLTQAKLGIDSATMAKIGKAAGAAYGNNFGDSVGENLDAARAAIQSGLLDPNATAQDTQAIVEQLDTVAQVMGEDVPHVARAAGQAIRTGLVKDGAGAMDLFVKSTQNGLNVSQDFLDSVTEYGTQFRKLGLDGPTAFALVSQAVKGGARDTDVASDALKEFSIRAVDGSKTSIDAYEALGLSAKDMTEKIARGGGDAKEGLGQVTTALRNIKDPALQSQIAVGLFGTQAEDLGAALGAMNLDTAAKQFGNVSGAANDAAEVIGGNAASSIEGAKRSIENSASQIGLALANAFGPSMEKVAAFVSSHQPEIIGFFKAITDATLSAADGALGFASGTLRAFAGLSEGVGATIGKVVDELGGFSNVLGDILSAIPGMGDEADALHNAADAAHGFYDATQKAADTARGLADGIDKTRPALQGMKDSFDQSAEASQKAAEFTRALGGAVTTLPDGHTITIQDNSPDTQARLEALGLRIEAIPGTKDFKIVANTAESQGQIDNWIAVNSGKEVPLIARVTFLDMNGSVTQNPALQTTHIRGGRFAKGGMFHGQGGPTDDANLIAISNTEHLAFITRAQAANPATIPFLDAINNGWVPPAGLLHGMIPGFAAGGMVPGKQFAMSMDPAQYQMGGFSTSAIDCSGMVSATVNSALGLDPFASRMATASEAGWLTAKGAISGLGGPGDISVGWYNGGAGGGHTAMTLGDGTNVESNGSDGVVIGGPVGASDPMFTDHAFIPAALLRGGDLGGGSAGGLGSGGGVGSAGGAGGFGGGGGASGGAGGGAGGNTSGATPVYVVNFPGGAATDANGTPSPVTPAGPSSAQPANNPAIDVQGKALDAGSSFLQANADDFLGTLGIRSSGGAVQALVKVIQDNMAAQIAEQLRKSRASAVSFIGRR